MQFVAGSVLVTLGLLLLTGIDFGILPMGRFIGSKLAERSSMSLLLKIVGIADLMLRGAES